MRDPERWGCGTIGYRVLGDAISESIASGVKRRLEDSIREDAQQRPFFFLLAINMAIHRYWGVTRNIRADGLLLRQMIMSPSQILTWGQYLTKNR